MILVSGLINVETSMQVKEFPIQYSPISYPFFKIKTGVSGVGMNMSKAFAALGDEVKMMTFIAEDEDGERIIHALEKEKIDTSDINKRMKETPAAVVLYDRVGNKQINCDLKDVQDQVYDTNRLREILKACEAVVLSNHHFNKELLKTAKKMKKLIATDVQVIHDTHDGFNKPFMMSSNILFLSGDNLSCAPEEFTMKLEELYHNQIIVIRLGENSAMMYVKEENKLYHLNSVQVRENVSTDGAGDALFSSFVHYYVKGVGAVEALKRAQVFVSYKLGEKGSNNGFADEALIEELLAKITFEEKNCLIDSCEIKYL